MNPYTILIGLSLAVVLSYLFDLAAKATKVPSVLLLLLAGIAFGQATAYWHLPVRLPPVLLQILGIVGLILIVLEGSLDLRLTRDKGPMVRRSFLAAATILVVASSAIAALLHFYTGAGWQSCLANAVALSVVSSAVAIPSVAGLTAEKKEFIIYESTFSDILGIMFFNFALQENFAQGVSLVTFGADILAVMVVAVLSTAALAFLLARLRGHIKFFLLFAFLVLLYSLAKQLHLSSLVLVLVFGLAVNNADLFLRGRRLQSWLHPSELVSELGQLKSLTAESAFLVRTFFFLVFGFSIDLTNLLNTHLLWQGLLVVAVLTFIRYLYLRFVARTDLLPELFIAPKGLISVLLFYSIPAPLLIGEVSETLMFLVILLTGVLMMVGLQLVPKGVPLEGEV
ncbi:cation:proton antiporter [Hymenobacter nivis]|uniref:Sodium:proton antiporter n=1 Tax=Hymenobacter nivis TaxID=1850093 RepID=A0A502HAA8_9BACT|nr:cation:proton antiporter [Hymenobacter nivis]TPG71689.1 sodium:proton antiporter [Hymenobacter nivis]